VVPPELLGSEEPELKSGPFKPYSSWLPRDTVSKITDYQKLNYTQWSLLFSNSNRVNKNIWYMIKKKNTQKHIIIYTTSCHAINLQ
jgi:hypothetical protein